MLPLVAPSSLASCCPSARARLSELLWRAAAPELRGGGGPEDHAPTRGALLAGLLPQRMRCPPGRHPSAGPKVQRPPDDTFPAAARRSACAKCHGGRAATTRPRAVDIHGHGPEGLRARGQSAEAAARAKGAGLTWAASASSDEAATIGCPRLPRGRLQLWMLQSRHVELGHLRRFQRRGRPAGVGGARFCQLRLRGPSNYTLVLVIIVIVIIVAHADLRHVEPRDRLLAMARRRSQARVHRTARRALESSRRDARLGQDLWLGLA